LVFLGMGCQSTKIADEDARREYHKFVMGRDCFE